MSGLPASGPGAISSGFGSYLTLGDSQYTFAAPYNLAPNIEVAVPNDGLKPGLNSHFNLRPTAWLSSLLRFMPEYRNSVYSVRLSFLCKPPGDGWVKATFETPSIVEIEDLRPLVPNPPPEGMPILFNWLVPVPTQQIVKEGAQFFLTANVALPIFNIRMAFFRVGG